MPIQGFNKIMKLVLLQLTLEILTLQISKHAYTINLPVADHFLQKLW